MYDERYIYSVANNGPNGLGRIHVTDNGIR